MFNGHVKQLAALTVHHSVPAIYKSREFAAAGDLLSYGGSGTDAYHLTGFQLNSLCNGTGNFQTSRIRENFSKNRQIDSPRKG